MNSLSQLYPKYDVVIVGARCAGAATAMLLARQGLRVLAIDRGAHGSDTLSTHALLRPALLQLHRWGLLERLEATDVPAVRSTTFHYGDEEVRVEIEPRNGVDALCAPRRTVLDSLLVDAAIEAGAEVRHGVRMRQLLRSTEGRVCGITVEEGQGRAVDIHADLVIGADGVKSMVAQQAEASDRHLASFATSVVYGYWSGLDIEGGYHFHYRPGVSIGRIPTHDGLTCVFVSTTPQRFHSEVRGNMEGAFRRLAAECAPHWVEKLDAASRATRLRGFPGHVGFLRQSFGPGWALVGDAAYFKDPITAHGITDALRDAEIVTRAVTRGTEAAFAAAQKEREDLSLPLFEITDRIASLDWELDELKELHLAMSRETGRETKAIARFDSVAETAVEPVLRRAG